MLYAYHKFITFGHAPDLIQLGLLRLSQASNNAYKKMIHWINAMGYSPGINVFQNKNPITILNEATVTRFLWFDLGNLAIP